MTKRIVVASVVGAALVITGGIFASNMGFKLNKTLFGPTATSTGTQLTALPFNQQTNLINAEGLLNDVSPCSGPANAALVSRFVRSADAQSFYSCSGGDNFPLTKGDAFYIQMSANLLNSSQSYIIVGSHDPAHTVVLSGPAGGSTGTNPYAAPYHGVATNAEQLLNEIDACPGSDVSLVARFVRTANATSFYSCAGGDNFALTAGDGYLIQVSTTRSFVPAHY